MSKKNKTPLGIFTESIGLYFSNFDKFVKYMTFPVLGQILGLLLILGITVIYSQNLPSLLQKFPNLANVKSLICLSVVVALPGLAIFTKAFWEYLVAYGAINSMFENLYKSGKVYDFNAHTQLIKRRSIPFIALWMLFGIFSLVASFPLFWVIGAIFTIYFVLIFQAFTFESDLSPLDCVKKSLSLVKGHFLSTLLLFCLIGVLTYIFIPQVVLKIFALVNLNSIIANLFTPISNLVPINDFNIFLKPYGIPEITVTQINVFFIETIIAQILIQYTLPMRSILWALWYKELDGGAKFHTQVSGKNKKPSEKLMEASRKKYGKKKLDRNIIERASKKDEE